MRSGSNTPATGDARPGREELVSDEMGPQELESQQAVLLGVLRRAAGAPVSYEQLRQAGIEFPASVASELELAGIDIEHCRLDGDSLAARHGGREPGLRLAPSPLDEAPTTAIALPPAVRLADQTIEPARRAAAGAGGRIAGVVRGVRARSATRDPLGGVPSVDLSNLALRRWLAPAALLAVVAAIAVALVTGLSAGGAAPSRAAGGAVAKTSAAAGDASRARHDRRTGSRRDAGAASRETAKAPSSAAQAVTPSTRQSKVPPASQPTPSVRQETSEGATAEARRRSRVRRSAASSGGTAAPASAASPELAAQYEAEGHDMLEGGQASAAIPVLSKALQATGEQPGDCLQPASEACLTYAYALYDLGRALLLSGNASAAVPVLQQRLQIDNQREAVEAALAAARAHLG